MGRMLTTHLPAVHRHSDEEETPATKSTETAYSGGGRMLKLSRRYGRRRRLHGAANINLTYVPLLLAAGEQQQNNTSFSVTDLRKGEEKGE
jgi:hypothetical protein